MASKTIIHREKTAEGLRGALEAHAAEAAEQLALALEPEATDDVEVPDMEDFQVLLRRRLDTSRKRLVAADEAHLKNLRRLGALRQSRDQAVGELRRLLARLRQGVGGAYGPGASDEVLLLEGATPRDPVALSRTVARALQHLQETALPLPADGLPGMHFEPALWIPLLQEPLNRLDQSLKALTEGKRDAVDSLLAKNAAKKEYDRLYSSSTRMLQEFFRYVGMDKMAATIRPRRRKASAARNELFAETPVAADPVPAHDPFDAVAASPDGMREIPTVAHGTAGIASSSGPSRPRLALLPAPRSPDPIPGARPPA